MKLKRDYIYIALLAVALFFVWRGCEKSKEVKQLKGLNEAVADSLRSYRNNEGQMVSKIQSLQFDKAKDFEKMKFKDSTIKWLQQTVKDFKGVATAAIVHNVSTVSNGSGLTTVNLADTVIKNDTVYIYPEYKRTWLTEWENGQIRATKDSIYHNIETFNKFEYVLGSTNKWFKKRTYEVQAINLNPNSTTKELRAFTISAKPKRLAVGIYAGYGYGFLSKKFEPQVGVGITYNFLHIK